MQKFIGLLFILIAASSSIVRASETNSIESANQALAALDSGDKLIETSSRDEERSCQGFGYCYHSGYGYNPTSGKYEYFSGYGNFNDCHGKESRKITEYTYRRDDGSTYTRTDEGWWSSCQIHM